MHQNLKLAAVGKGVFEKNHPKTTCHAQANLEQSYAPLDLPPVIQRAIARLMDPAFPIELNAPELKAMATLLRRVDKTDGARQFWVRRVNLADLFGKCERTVTNWLNALEAAGMIVKEQGRSGWGRFQSAILQLTPRAIGLLGLDQPLKKLKTEDFNGFVNPEEPLRKKTSPRLCDTGFEFQSSSKRQLPKWPEKLSTGKKAENGDGQPQQASEAVVKFRDAQDRWTKVKDGDSARPLGESTPADSVTGLLQVPPLISLSPFVPKDCLPLLEMNITRFGVYKLMKEARLAGKRLADIVEARQDALTGARNTYSLMVHLIHDPLDYRTIAEWQREKANETLLEKMPETGHSKEVFREDARKRWLPGQWLVIPEQGVELKACSKRVLVHKEGPPEAHELVRGAWVYRFAIAGAELYSFWRGLGRWSDLKALD